MEPRQRRKTKKTTNTMTMMLKKKMLKAPWGWLSPIDWRGGHICFVLVHFRSIKKSSSLKFFWTKKKRKKNKRLKSTPFTNYQQLVDTKFRNIQCGCACSLKNSKKYRRFICEMRWNDMRWYIFLFQSILNIVSRRLKSLITASSVCYCLLCVRVVIPYS